jgi:hypothetical protein
MLLSTKRGVVVLFIVLAFFSIAGLLGPRLNHSAWPMALLAKNSKVEPPITHIVLFQFKEGTSNTTIKQVRILTPIATDRSALMPLSSRQRCLG